MELGLYSNLENGAGISVSSYKIIARTTTSFDDRSVFVAVARNEKDFQEETRVVHC